MVMRKYSLNSNAVGNCKSNTTNIKLRHFFNHTRPCFWVDSLEYFLKLGKQYSKLYISKLLWHYLFGFLFKGHFTTFLRQLLLKSPFQTLTQQEFEWSDLDISVYPAC